MKQADHLRNGTAKAILSLSREHTTSLFHSILDSDLSTYLQIHNRLLNSSNPLRHIPLRVFIPSPDISSPPTSPQPDTSTSTPKNVHSTKTGSFKVVQMLVPARGAAREATTVGMALNSMLPGLFPSRRDCIHAVVILHGVRLPMSAPLEGVMREGAYSDGWVMGVVVMLR